MKRHCPFFQPASRSAGFILLESLVAILVFSFGVMGILALQANSIAVVHDAKLRSDAGLLANRIIGQMWADYANLATYKLNDDGSAPCGDGANASGNANVNAWLDDMGKTMPLSAPLRQQIKVGANNTIKVTICWRTPQDDPAQPSRRHVTTAQIQAD